MLVGLLYPVSYTHLSTTETSSVGTRRDIPVNLPDRSGMTFPTALAAPVVEGMIFPEAARPPRQSFLEVPSTVFWLPVMECTVAVSYTHLDVYKRQRPTTSVLSRQLMPLGIH